MVAKRLFSRVILSLFTLVLISFFSFFLLHLAPGDPAAMYFSPSASVADQQKIRESLGLNSPIFFQYLKWLERVVHGDLGYSYSSGEPVVQAIGDRLPATLILSVSALFVIVLLSFPLGLFSGLKKGSIFDKAVTFFGFLGYAIPPFWLGLMLILFFSVILHWFPTSGFVDPDFQEGSLFQEWLNIGFHLALPLSTTVIGGLAGLTRYTRSSTIQVLSQDYIKAARARGLSTVTIVFKHCLKNAAIPVVTLLGLSLPGLVSGAFVIEYIFGWPGMGQLGIAALFSRDYPVLMGTLMMSAVLILCGNFLADLAYRWIDPRIQDF